MSPARSPGADRAQRASDTPVRQDALPSRDVLTASVVSAAFGIAWALAGASGLPAGAQAAVRGLGIVIGVVIIVRAMLLRRSAPVPAMPGFRSRQYRTVVAAEVAAIIAGLLALALTGNGKYLAAWFAVVVGVHFVAFGRFFSRMYYALGAVVTAGGVAAAIAGVAGASAAQIGATAGLVAAASLFTAAAWRIFPHRPFTATRHG
jgi:hypothetical protein